MIQQVVEQVTNGLRNSPGLLAVVALNLVSIVVVVWFLRELAEGARKDRDHLLEVITKCVQSNPRGE